MEENDEKKVEKERDKIMIIGASILDVMVRPADRHVFETGSSAAEDISISFGGDALNEATVLASLGKKVSLQTLQLRIADLTKLLMLYVFSQRIRIRAKWLWKSGTRNSTLVKLLKTCRVTIL